MKILAKKIKAKYLKPGDLFSTADQTYWDRPMPTDVIGEKVYIRTSAPCPPDQAEVEIFKIKIQR